MRMKDDQMKNGQLKAAYNVQVATQHQYIVGFGPISTPGDMRCFQPFMEKPRTRDIQVPKIVVADAGYASERNYLYVLGEENASKRKSYALNLSHRIICIAKRKNVPSKRKRKTERIGRMWKQMTILFVQTNNE